MTHTESFYTEICDRYLVAMSQCDYAKAAEIVKEVRRWLGCRRSTEQILPTGDITGQATCATGQSGECRCWRGWQKMADTKIFMIKDMAFAEVRGAVFADGVCYDLDDRKWFRPNGTIRSRRRMLVDAKRFVRKHAPWVFDVTEEE